MKRVSYVVRLDKDPESDWGASVPDLPGCIAVAKTVDGALRRIQVAIEMHLAGLRADGIRLPRPRRRMLVGAPRSPSRSIYAWIDVAA